MSTTGIDPAAATGNWSLTASVALSTEGPLGARTTATLEIPQHTPTTQLSASPAIAVTIGHVAEPDPTYSGLGQTYATSTAWAQPPADTVSRIMEDNLKAYSKSGRLASLLNGLGSELAKGLSGNQREWHQAAVVYRPGYRGLDSSTAAAAGTSAIDALGAASEIENTINLKIRTKSGKEVDIAIVFGGDGKAIQDSLSIDIRTSEDLDAAEQAAIGKLAQGLDSALQGIGGEVPKVDIAGLIGFDATVIAGVDLKLRAASQRNGLQSFEFRADAVGRSLALQTAAGRLAVNVDLSSPAPLGSADQQSAAVQKFLEQFDAANVRAHGEELLLEQFKAAFAQLNSSYPPPEARPAPALPEWVLSAEDRAVLTGLADFEASMSGDFDNGSASKSVTEAGHMRYEATQTTDVKGVAKDSGLAIVQAQTAALHATQERSRGGLKLNKEGGNYDVFRLEDKTSTTTAFEYDDFELKSASAEENSSRLDQYEKWVNHELVEQRSTPYSTRVLRDLVEELLPRF
jgi:hypothetical protein